MDDGRVLLALENGFHTFDLESGDVAFAACPDDIPAENRFNDGTVDPAGRFIAGTMPKAGETGEPQGNLYALDGAEKVRCLERNLTIQNGLAFSPDGRTLYLSDSGSAVQSVWRYDYDPASGRCTNRRLHFDMHATRGRPDGAAVDADGGYWIAAVGGWALVRLTPAGQVDRTIELPIEKPTKPAFGGKDLRTLFVTSMSLELDHADPRHAEAGNLFAVDAGVQGLPVASVSVL
jgi:sugar lactone lactonase YvrE